jgi:hypothetical protein
MLNPGESNARLFHDQIIPYGCDRFDAPCNLNRSIDRLLRINEAAQLNDALEGINTDLEWLEKIILGKQSLTFVVMTESSRYSPVPDCLARQGESRFLR